jgi:hypothetical protein
MAMSFRIIALRALPLLALGGCESFSQTTHAQTSASLDPGFAEAVKYNAAIQTIDPDPVYAETGAQPGDSGAKGAAAVRRYRTDQVKDVETLTTTESSDSGSGPN